MVDLPDAHMMHRGGSGATTGLTLVEVVIASLVASIVAGGTLMAFVASTRMTTAQDLMTNAEASALAQQKIEEFRNHVAEDDNWLATEATKGWVVQTLPGGGGTESNLNPGPNARYCYRVTAEDCDGVGGTGDCHAVQTSVCWNDLTDCPCP